MKPIITFFLLSMFIYSSYANQNNKGISAIVFYLINNQTQDNQITSMTFVNYKFFLFEAVKENNPQLKNTSELSKSNEKIGNNLEGDYKIAQRILYEHKCSIGISKAIINTIIKNEHGTALKVTYGSNPIFRYYSEPLQISGCDLILVYSESVHPKAFPLVVENFFYLYEKQGNGLKLVIYWEGMNID